MLEFIIILLILIILLLSMSLYLIIKRSIYFSKKEKEFINFTIKIYKEYAMDLGVQSLEMHEKLVKELNQIEKKMNNEN